MSGDIRNGDCVRLADGRPARVRERLGDRYKVRVRRKRSDTHQFLIVEAKDLAPIPCPKGWMSPDGYRRYLRVTLAKLRQRQRSRSSKAGRKK